MTGVHLILDYFIAWASSRALVKWLNNWNEIEHKLVSITSTKSWDGSQNEEILNFKSNFTKVRTTIVVILLVCPTLFFGTSILFTGSHPGYPVAFCMEIVYSYISSICFGAEDVKTVIMFKAVEDSLGKVGHY